MADQFILTITEHRYLGWILVPALSERTNQAFITIKEQASVQLIGHEGYDFTEAQQKVIKRFEKYSDHNLMCTFSKESAVTEFYNRLTPERFDQRIRPYLEDQLKAIVKLAMVNEIPIYQRNPGYLNLYESERIEIVAGEVDAVFNFEKNDTSFNYFLTIHHKDAVISLLNKEIIVLVNDPGIVLINQQLFWFNDTYAKKLMPFSQRKSISIPPTSLARYLETFVLNAIRNQTVILKGIDIEHVDSTGTAHLFLEEDLTGNPILTLRFKYGIKYFDMQNRSVKEVAFSKEGDEYKFLRFERNKNEEDKILAELSHRGIRAYKPGEFKLPDYTDDNTENLYLLVEWINRNSELLENNRIELHQEHYTQRFFSSDLHIDTQFTDDNDWFELRGYVFFGDFKIAFVLLRNYIVSGTREYILPDGRIAILPLEWFAKYRELFKFAASKGENLRLDKHHFNLLLNSDIEAADVDKIRAAYDFTSTQDVELPKGINAQLRSYQKTGFEWMLHLRNKGFGGCLADDMGLGKTLQTLTVIQKIYEEAAEQASHLDTIEIDTNEEDEKLLEEAVLQDMTSTEIITRPNLKQIQKLPASIIVMPKSLLYNWANEIHKFCPDLLLYIYGGNRRVKTKDIGRIFRHYNIILTSYGLIRNDLEFLGNYEFHYLILDESHFIKNPSSKAYQAVMDIKAKHRLAITGTPIENSLQDLWAQFNFINPGLLGSRNYFQQHFVIPITKFEDEERQAKLQKLISPFILRRTKDEVAKDLPPLTEQIMYCEMTDEQKAMYKREKSSIRNKILENFAAASADKSMFMALKGLMRLRLMANHPILVDSTYKDESGKFDRIIRNLANLRAENHKVLIFSSFVRHLHLLRDYFKANGWDYSILTGETVDRERAVREFQEQPSKTAFLISLKAGGVGLNLTEADYVFILDPWWNPAAELQAINRAHRIGQNKKVMVYRFITTDTVEEKILKLQDKKTKLAETFIQSNNPLRHINQEEIEELFK